MKLEPQSTEPRTAMEPRRRLVALAAGAVIMVVAFGGWFAVRNLAAAAFGSDSPLPFALGIIPALLVFVLGLTWLSGRAER